MQFSIRDLLGFTALVCVQLTLTQLPFFVAAGLLTIGVVATYFFAPTVVWRPVVYGGILGVVVLIVGLLVYLRLEYGPSVSYRLSPANDVWDRARPFILPLGSLVGGTLGFVLWRPARRESA